MSLNNIYDLHVGSYYSLSFKNLIVNLIIMDDQYYCTLCTSIAEQAIWS